MLQHRCRKAPVLFLVALSRLPAVAQSPTPVSNPPEIQTHDSPATFRTGVNLVLVPVVVRDSQGRAVGNLLREDFHLEHKSKPQIITRFSVERPGSAAGIATPERDEGVVPRPVAPPASPLPQHFVAYLFDDVHLGVADLQRARTATERHLSESLDPADRAAIYTGRGRTALEFTDDRLRIGEALERIQPYTGAGCSSTDCPHVDYYTADLIVNKHDRQALALATNDALHCMSPNLRHPPATLLVAAEGMARSAALRVLRVGDFETRQLLTALRDLVLRMAAAPGSRSIVLVSSGFLLTTDDRANETEVMERAIRANVTINSLDARGLFGVLGGEASQPTMNGGQIELRVQ